MQTKFACPTLSSTTLHRRVVQTLIEVTDAAIHTLPRCKLVLLSAPAGYGKTTLLADFAERTHLMCCWYLLDHSDREKIVFLNRLLVSIGSRFPDVASNLDSLLEQLPSTEEQAGQTRLQPFFAVIEEFCTLIQREVNEAFTIILCNYHEVDYPEINLLVDHFLRHLPPQCLVMIESRTLPTLDLDILLTHREIFAMGSDALRFSAQEVYDLAHLLGMNTLNHDEAEQLAGSFEGWITGILLSTRLGLRFFSPATGHTKRSLLPLGPNRRNLFSYVMHEVFQQEQDIYPFLLHTSILAQLTVESCNALLNIEDAGSRLAYIERQGLFVSRMSREEELLTYICHPVLRELFVSELQKQQPEYFLELHRRAACFFQRSQIPDLAIYHALEAGEYDMAAQVMSAISQLMLVQGSSETIAEWIDLLPPPTLEQYPHLLLARANIWLMHYKPDAALPLIEQAAKHPHHSENASVQSEILIARGIAQWFQGEYSQARFSSEQALALLPTEEQVLRAIACQTIGVCICLEGQYQIGITHLQQALRLWGQMENRQTALLHGQLANAYDVIGSYPLAEHHYTRSIASWDRLADVRGKINSLIGLGANHLHQGNYTSALPILNEALTLAQQHQVLRGEAYALVNLGVLYQDQNRFTEALAITEDGMILARQSQDKYLIHHALVNLATIHLHLGDAQTALLLLSEIEVGSNTNDDIMSYEEALRELLFGAIYLAQQRYEEAYKTLRAVEENARRTSWKRGHIKALLRLAAYHLAQGQSTAATRRIEQVFLLNRQGDYDHLVQTEIRRLPGVPQLIEVQSQQKPEMPPVGHPLRSDALYVAPKRCSILALGSPALLIDGTKVTHWRMSRGLELFFFLLDRGQVSKEQIIDVIWHNEDIEDQTLRSTIHYLRKVIGEECLPHYAGSYALQLSERYGKDIYSDVLAFQEYYALGKETLASGAYDEAAQAFEEMMKLYRGDYLSSIYSDWCILRRDELRRTYMDALSQLARLAWNRKHFDACLYHWQQLLALDNCLEEAHYGIMCCYLRQGKRAMAHRQYQQCRAILQQELSTIPGDSIQKLYQKHLKSSDQSLQKA